MSSRSLVIWAAMLATCLLLAVIALAVLSVEPDPLVIEEAPETLAGEAPGLATGDPCDETTPPPWLADVPPNEAWISEC